MTKPLYCKHCLKLITNAERKNRMFCNFACNQRFKRARAKNEQWKHEHFDTVSKYKQVNLAAQNIVERIGLLYVADAARTAIDAILITQLNNSADDRINSDGKARDEIAARYPRYLS